MRIAQIVASLEARHGGPSRSVLGLSNGLATAGHEVDLLTTESGLGSTAQPSSLLALRHFPRQWPQRLTVSSALRRHLQSTTYDVVHNHGLWLRPLHYAGSAARRSGNPLVISPRGMMSPWSWQHRRWRKFIAGALIHPNATTLAAGWHATSEEEATDIRRLGFTQPICVASNGVEIPNPESLADARQYWLQRCPELRDHRVALFYSRFHPKKRILDLMELWTTHTPSDWLLLAVGIPEHYSIAALKAYAKRNGVGERVLVFDGTDAPAPYAAADVYLLPSHSENFGMTVAEAMAHGLPVLTTDTTPWRELDQREAGHCVPWSAFATTLPTFLRQKPTDLKSQGEHARNWMLTDFSWGKTAIKLATFYRDLANLRR